MTPQQANQQFHANRNHKTMMNKIHCSIDKIKKGEGILGYDTYKNNKMISVLFPRQSRKDKLYGLHHPLRFEKYILEQLV